MLIVLVICLFGLIGLLALFREDSDEGDPVIAAEEGPDSSSAEERTNDEVFGRTEVVLPDGDRMEELFNTGLPKLPIVQTISYSSRVPWLQGRSAWVEHYAAHYGTSRHFIARSLNGRPDYESQNVANGDRFNVFVEDKPISFHLVVDNSRCRLWVYCLDEETGIRTLLKAYPVGLGRPDPRRAFGSLTPVGVYTLGDKIAIYRPGKVGLYNKQKVEMISVFGTRWIPFDEEIEGCTAPSKGLGLHACPCVRNERTGEWEEDRSGLGKYDSDGCIRLATEDMEELFAVVITKPTKVYLVRDFFDASLPGTEEETD